MTTIELSVTVNQTKEQVYNILKNIEQFPKFMRDVRKIEVIENKPSGLVTLWEVNIDGAMVTWKEEDIFDDEATSVKFKMLEGDYIVYSGTWDINSLSHKTKISLFVNIDWGVPAFVKFPEVKNILLRKTKKSLKSMLIAIKKKAEHPK